MSRRAKNAAADYAITQQQLEDFRLADRLAKESGKDRDTRHKLLKELVLEGALVEPGALTIQLSTAEVHPFTADEVARIMGPEVVDEIRCQLKGVIQYRMAVIETPLLVGR